MRAGLVREDGTILASASRPTGFETPREEMLARFAQAIREVLDSAPGVAIEGTGIGMPGLQDEAGRVASASNLPTLNGVDLRAEVSRLTGVPAAMENDLNVVALGEYRFGGHRVAGNLLVVAIGTGVGAAVVQAGRPLNVYRGSLGDPGHVLVEPGGRLCRCGARGCLEAYCAGWALIEQASEFGLAAESPRSKAQNPRSKGTEAESNGGLRPADILDAARAGNDAACALLRRSAAWLGMGLASFCALYQPERIVLGGNLLVEAADLLVSPAHEQMRGIVQPWMRDIPVELSRIPQTAGVLGGAALGLGVRC